MYDVMDFVEVTVIATLVRRIDKPNVTVGIDGGLFRFHPHFRRIIKKTVAELLQNRYNVSVYLHTVILFM